MRLIALSVGQAVPRAQLAGSVHSVFRRACNVRLANGDLVTFLPTDVGDLPQGVRLDAPAGFAFDACGLQAGRRVACTDGRVSFDGASLSVDLRGARVWRSRLTTLCVVLRHPHTLRAWDTAQRALRAHLSGLDSSVMGLQSPSAQFIERLQDATVRLDAEAAGAVARSLIGLGPGLTPAGDDFLVGYLAGLWCAAGDAAERRAFVSALGSHIVGQADRTHPISRVYLVHAARGEVSSALDRLARAIADGAADEAVRAATRVALSVGYTSGADGVAGLLAGLAVWQDSRLTQPANPIYLASI